MGKLIKMTEQIKELYLYEESKLDEQEFFDKSIALFNKLSNKFFEKTNSVMETEQI